MELYVCTNGTSPLLEIIPPSYGYHHHTNTSIVKFYSYLLNKLKKNLHVFCCLLLRTDELKANQIHSGFISPYIKAPPVSLEVTDADSSDKAFCPQMLVDSLLPEQHHWTFVQKEVKSPSSCCKSCFAVF